MSLLQQIDADAVIRSLDTPGFKHSSGTQKVKECHHRLPEEV